MAQLESKFKVSLLAASVVAVLSMAPTMSVAAEVADDEEAEVIQVRGIRGSMLKSVLDKRAADQVIDTITATDIGKLPDTTIADSLQRITGVSINRSGGEGSSISVRGTPQVMTTLNGEQMLSAGSITSIQPNFDDIPSTMVNGLDVIKSMQAKTMHGGMSGVVNLKTVRPIDMDEGMTLVGKVAVADGSMGDDYDTKLSLFSAYNWNSDVAVYLNVSRDDTNLADYTVGSTGNDWGFNASEATGFVQDGVDANNNGRLDDVYYAFQGHAASNKFIERERNGINGSIQWNINDNFQLTGDVFYTDMEEYEYIAAFNASQDWSGVTGWFTPDEGGSTAHENIVQNSETGEFEDVGGAYNSFQAGTLQARRTQTHSETHYTEKEAVNTNLQLDYDDGDRLRASIRWVHGEAREDQSQSVVDSYFNSGEQGDRYYLGEGGEPISPSNPWGYQGQWAELPDGTPVEDSHYMIPIHVQYGSTVHYTMPTMTVTEADGSVTEEVLGSNVDRYSLTSTNLEGYYSDSELDAYRFDVSYDFGWDHLASVDFGARYAERDVETEGWYGVMPATNGYGDPFLARWKDSEIGAPFTGESYIAPISFNDEVLAGKIKAISDFEGTSGLGTLYFVNPKAMSNPTKFHEQVYGVPNYEMLTNSNTYDLTEETTNYYLQGNLDGEVLGLGYTGNVGVRYVKTEFDINQYESTSGTTYEIDGQEFIVGGGPGSPNPIGDVVNTKRDYDDWLPSLNLSLELTDDMKLRGAFTKTVTTHDALNLAGGVTINRDKSCGVTAANGDTVFCATGASQTGNPYLDPWRSKNYDVSWEWYFDETGIFSIGAFYMDIESFINQETVYLPQPDSDGVVRGYDVNSGQFLGTTPTTTKSNGDGGTIKGMEVGYQQAFDFLPGIWSGFGVTANYTYSPSDSDASDYYGKELPIADNSEHTSNFALWYEKDGLQARIAHNYRSKQYKWVVNKAPYQFARWQDSTHYVDASVSYDVNEIVTLMLQGTNLFEEEQEQYLQWKDLVDKRYINERKLQFGVQVRL